MVYRLLASVVCLFVLAGNALAGTIILEGNYQGKNIYVQNPFASSGVGFCTYEVRVNGDVTTDEINSSAFEIDFANLQLNVGDPVTVQIKHKDDCRPKVLNPEALLPQSTFEIVQMKVSKEGVLEWSTRGESGKLAYVVEQFRWNKWIRVGEVPGIGTSGQNDYQFKVVPHSEENQFRVKQVDYTGKDRASKPVKFRSDKTVVEFNPKKVNDKLMFTDETLFEIYDSFGNIVKKGFGREIDATNLKSGVYYLNYDNKTGQFQKK